MQGHAAIAVRRAGKERLRKLADSRLLAVHTPLGVSQDDARDGRVKALFEQSLVGSRIVRLDEGLMGLCQLPRVLTQGKLVVVEAPLHIEVRFHQVHIAFPLGTHNGGVVNLQPGTDGFKLLSDVSPTAIGTKQPPAESWRVSLKD
jgi:hypothetical protein